MNDDARPSPAALDLRRLDDGESHVEWSLTGAELGIDSEDLRLSGPVTVELRLYRTDHQVQIQGRIHGAATHACGRCAEDVREAFDTSFVCLAVEAHDEMADGSDDDDVLVYEGGRIELGDLVRQHVLLTVPMAVSCRPDCAGLCPECGTNLNESSCSCRRESSDPRWSTLTALLGEDDRSDRTPEPVDVDDTPRKPGVDT